MPNNVCRFCHICMLMLTSNYTHTHYIAICSSGCHPVGGYCNRPRECLYVHTFTSNFTIRFYNFHKFLNRHFLFLSCYSRCNSGWTGSNCGTCVPSQGCCKLLARIVNISHQQFHTHINRITSINRRFLQPARWMHLSFWVLRK